MDAILKQLKKQRENLVSAAQKRDDYFMNRSEAWQNSASGVIYETKTQNIADVISTLDKAITKLDNHLNDC